MSTMDMLSEFGMKPADIDLFGSDPSGLVKLRRIYAANCEKEKGKSNLTSEEVESLKAKAKSNENAQKLSDSVISDIREMIYKAFDAEPDSMILLIEEVKEFLDLMKFEQKEMITALTKSSEDKVAATKDAEESYALLERLQTLIQSIWNIMKPNLDLKDDVFKADGEFPLKDSKANGLVPSLPRMPDKPGTVKTGGRGRPIHKSNLRFKWNGKEVPEGYNASQVAKELISDRRNGVLVQWSDIKSMLEEKKIDLTKTSPWKLEFETGVLEGYIVEEKKNAPVVSSGKATTKK